MHRDPTPDDAKQLLFGEGLTLRDYFLVRTAEASPWLICRWAPDGGMTPVAVEDEVLADLCRMVLLQGGVERFASVEALRERLARGPS